MTNEGLGKYVHLRCRADLAGVIALLLSCFDFPHQTVERVQVRKEVTALLEQHRGILHPEHFDGGVICHLQKRSETAAANALREIGRRNDFPAANNKPAYLTHWLMKLAAPEEPSSLPQAGMLSGHSSAYGPIR